MRQQVKKYPTFPPGKSPLYFGFLMCFSFSTAATALCASRRKT